ncbi:MAG TPA: glycosyltransferase family 4 protein, partial [Methylomirabilota bacterium]|nr:glycosyltransferase family 4 protein [Methylomirabilota bacterium]
MDPETTSGGETYERELLAHLARLGMVSDIILARHKRAPESVSNVFIHRLAMGRGLRWPIAALALPLPIARVYRQTRFDLLRVHSLRYIGPAAILARRLFGVDVPIVAHHHHLDPSPLNRVIERRVLFESERIITVSQFSKRQLASALGVSPARVETVPNGVDERFTPGPAEPGLRARYQLGDGPVALFLGGLKPRKNLPFLLDAWGEIASARPGVTLMIAGDGLLAGRLRRQAEGLGPGAHVVFTGRVPEAEKVAHYRLADVFLFPSVLEGFGLAVGEAMSCGLPVVASDQGALPELVAEGEGGFVCRSGDRRAFARATLRLFNEEHLRRRFGVFNRDRVERQF